MNINKQTKNIVSILNYIFNISKVYLAVPVFRKTQLIYFFFGIFYDFIEGKGTLYRNCIYCKNIARFFQTMLQFCFIFNLLYLFRYNKTNL